MILNSKYQVDFKQVKKNINFENLLIYLGYKKNERESTERWIKFKDKHSNATLLLIDSTKGNYKILINKDTNKFQDVIGFINELYEGDWHQTIEALKIFSEKSKFQSSTIKFIQAPTLKAEKKFIFSKQNYNKHTCKNLKLMGENLFFYLTNKRKIANNIILSNRFSNIVITINIFYKKEALQIPNYDTKNNIINYEFLTEKGKKSNAKGGRKSIYTTERQNDDENIIITQSILDLYSYYDLTAPDNKNTYGISTGGELAKKGKDTIKEIITNTNNNLNFKKVILAFNNDEAGKNLTNSLTNFIQIYNDNLKIIYFPIGNNKDLNEMLVKIKNSVKIET